MKKHHCVFFAFLVSAMSMTAYAYPPDIDWLITYGGNQAEYGLGIYQIADYGFAAAGFIDAGIASPFVLKTDAHGTQQWMSVQSRNTSHYFSQSCMTTDGGFILTGSERLDDTYTPFAMKISSSGESLWTYASNIISDVLVRCITSTPDGGCLIGGATTVDDDHRAFLLKLDAGGSYMWHRTYMGDGYEDCMTVIPSLNGEYLMTCQRYEYDEAMWVMRITSGGDSISGRRIGIPYLHWASGAVPTPDGGMAVAGMKILARRLDSYVGSIFVFRFDAVGDSLWSREFMILDDITTGNIALVRDGGFVIASNRGMLRLSAAGDSLWVLPYRCTHCAVTAEGGYVLIGRMGLDNSDFFILKTDHDPHLAVPVSGAVVQDFILHSNYPNPFNAATTIRFDLPVAGQLTLSVFDMNGRLVRTLAEGRYTAGSHAVRFEAGDLPSGLYFCRLNSGRQTAIQKMILLK